jgi:hypothetical protein
VKKMPTQPIVLRLKRLIPREFRINHEDTDIDGYIEFFETTDVSNAFVMAFSYSRILYNQSRPRVRKETIARGEIDNHQSTPPDLTP